LAFVTGQISGLEVLDFDTRQAYHAWREQMRDEGLETLAERLASGYLEASPQGIHLPYRCRLIEVEGNQKLAGCLIGEKPKTLIETRGEGGLVVVAPSADGVHRSGLPYTLLQGSIATIASVTGCDRQKLLAVARKLDELPPAETTSYPLWQPRSSVMQPLPRIDSPSAKEEYPGQIFNRQASWEKVLGPYGWRLLYEREDGEGYWTKNQDVHATTNYHGSDKFYVFSTATKFVPRKGYSKFAAYTLLNYGCLTTATFAAAARQLARDGYCAH
jgi:putative DNA primase/helicase